MALPDFVDLNKLAAGCFDGTDKTRTGRELNVNLLRAISVASPPWCAALKFLNPSPFFGGRRAEPLQKILHLEIFWGFRTRTAPAGGGQYLTGGGVIGAAAGGGRWGCG